MPLEFVYNGVEGDDDVDTSERVAYRDAIRQVYRALEHRSHHLHEALQKAATEQEASEIRTRIDEVRHVLEIVHSLHR